MIDKLLKTYLDIHYCNQKLGNKFNVQNGLVNIILFELSFLMAGLFLCILVFLGIKNTILVAVLTIVFIYLYRTLFDEKLKAKIDFDQLEIRYEKLSKTSKHLYFVLAIVFFVSSIFLTILPIRIIGYYN